MFSQDKDQGIFPPDGRDAGLFSRHHETRDSVPVFPQAAQEAGKMLVGAAYSFTDQSRYHGMIGGLASRPLHPTGGLERATSTLFGPRTSESRISQMRKQMHTPLPSTHDDPDGDDDVDKTTLPTHRSHEKRTAALC